MATASKASKGFEGLRCVHCGDVDCLAVKVEDLAIECRGCGEEIGRGEVEALMAKWARLWAWIDSAAPIAAPK